MNHFVDPIILSASSERLRRSIADAAGVLAGREGGRAVRRHLFQLAKSIHVETMAEIAERIAVVGGVTLEQLRTDRSRRISQLRLQAFTEIYETGSYGYQQIADFFGLLCHTTVLKGIQNLKRRQAADEQ